MWGRRVVWLVAVGVVAVVLAGCGDFFNRVEDPAGAFLFNTTDESARIVASLPGEETVVLAGVVRRSQSRAEAGCAPGPVEAIAEADGSVIDVWEWELCEGDTWTIPHGAVIINDTDVTLRVTARDTYPSSATVFAGRRGTFGAECTGTPIQVWASGGSVPLLERVEPLCPGDVWTISGE